MRGAFRRKQKTPAQLMKLEAEVAPEQRRVVVFSQNKGSRDQEVRGAPGPRLSIPGPRSQSQLCPSIPREARRGHTPSGPHLPQHLLLRGSGEGKEGLRSSRDPTPTQGTSQDVVSWVIICYRNITDTSRYIVSGVHRMT